MLRVCIKPKVVSNTMDNASALRLTIFLSVFAFMALLEAYKPARKAVLNRKQRWVGNLSMVVIGAVVARLLLPTTLLGVSSWAASEGLGLFNSIGSALPFTLVVILCVLILFDSQIHIHLTTNINLETYFLITAHENSG